MFIQHIFMKLEFIRYKHQFLRKLSFVEVMRTLVCLLITAQRFSEEESGNQVIQPDSVLVECDIMHTRSSKATFCGRICQKQIKNASAEIIKFFSL